MGRFITSLDSVIHFVLSPFFAIGLWQTRLINRLLGLDHFFVRDAEICQGFIRVKKSRIERIRAWQVIMEMGFDLIGFELCDGTRLTWPDYDEKLANLLRKTIPEREIETIFASVDV
jgi:hypothetical protein